MPVCPGCQGTPELLFEQWGMLCLEERLHEIESAYHGCPTCGLISANPLPPEDLLRAHYTTMESSQAMVCEERSAAAIDWILERCSPTRVLEIGCGDGVLLARMRDQAGCSVVGVDPSSVRREKAFAGGTRVVPTLEDVQGEYDLIVLSHVLEHVHDPAGLLEALHGFLAPSGQVYIEVPAIDRASAATEQIVHLTHLHHWTTSTLREFCGRRGLETIASGDDVVADYPCARVLLRSGSAAREPVDAAGAKEAFLEITSTIADRYEKAAGMIRDLPEVVVFGGGADTLHLLRSYPDLVPRVSMIIDSDRAKQRRTIESIEIRPPAERPTDCPVFLSVMSHQTQEGMQRALLVGGL